jgi:hypothetical protein
MLMLVSFQGFFDLRQARFLGFASLSLHAGTGEKESLSRARWAVRATSAHVLRCRVRLLVFSACIPVDVDSNVLHRYD